MKPRPKANATYICGEVGLHWDEPFMVNTDGGSRQCEALSACTALSAWIVEIVGWAGKGEPPYLHPVRYACMNHVGGVMEGLLPDGGSS